jgi:hypothetical protein
MSLSVLTIEDVVNCGLGCKFQENNDQYLMAVSSGV